MQTLFIVNENAGQKRAGQIWKSLKKDLDQLFPQAKIIYTKAADHAQVIASQHSDHRIIVVGGDGTFHEALQGSMLGLRQMGIIAAGSGNDLVRALGHAKDPKQALLAIHAGKKKTIDVGKIGAEFFVNGAGIGYDAKVTYDVSQMKSFLRGKSRYLLAILKNLFFYRAKEMKIVADDFSHEGKVLCLTIGNGAYLGGGIPIVPDARLDDGLLSVTLIEDVGLCKRIRYLGKVLTGRHKDEDFVHMLDTTFCQIEAEEDLIYHQDGEVFYGKKLEVSVEVGALTMLGG